MGQHSCCNQQKVKRGLWSPEEDEKLIRHITTHGYGCWSEVPEKAGLQRCGKSCRLRWINYLRPDIRRGRFSPEEEKLIISLHGVVGNRWAHIASHLPGRTDNEIKNYWNSWIKKKLKKPPLLSTTPHQTNKTPSTNITTTDQHIILQPHTSQFPFNQVDFFNNNNQDFMTKPPVQFRETLFPLPNNNPFLPFDTNATLEAGVHEGDYNRVGPNISEALYSNRADQPFQDLPFWQQDVNATPFSMGMDSACYLPPLMEVAPPCNVDLEGQMARENHVSEWGVDDTQQCPSSCYLLWDQADGEELVPTTTSSIGAMLSSSFPSSI